MYPCRASQKKVVEASFKFKFELHFDALRASVKSCHSENVLKIVLYVSALSWATSNTFSKDVVSCMTVVESCMTVVETLEAT